eukprot:scaffold48234_cov60-Attheya_sp.AAC.3
MSQAEAFFLTYMKYHIKHFKQWWTIVLPFAIASVDPCAQVFAQWYLGGPPPDLEPNDAIYEDK